MSFALSTYLFWLWNKFTYLEGKVPAGHFIVLFYDYSALALWAAGLVKYQVLNIKKIIWSFDLTPYMKILKEFCFFMTTVCVSTDLSSLIILFLIFHYFVLNPIFGTKMLQMRLKIFFMVLPRASLGTGKSL